MPSFTEAFIVGFLKSGCFGALFRRSSLSALLCKAFFGVPFHRDFFCARFCRRLSSGLFSQGLFLRSFTANIQCIHSGGSFPVRFFGSKTSMGSFTRAYCVHFLAVDFLRALLCRAFFPCPIVRTASSALTFARLLPLAPSRGHLPCFFSHGYFQCALSREIFWCVLSDVFSLHFFAGRFSVRSFAEAFPWSFSQQVFNFALS